MRIADLKSLAAQCATAVLLVSLGACSAAPKRAIEPGMWLMQSPDGTVETVEIRALTDTSYYLSAPGNPVAGVYDFDKNQLVVTQPDNPRMQGLTWRLDAGGKLVLVQESRVDISGRRLVSATLTRQQ